MTHDYVLEQLVCLTFETLSTLNTTPDRTQQFSSLYSTILTCVDSTLSSTISLLDYTLH